MKIKNIIALALIGGFALTGCDYNGDNFEGLDEKIELTDVQSLEYTLTDADYTTLTEKAASISSDNANRLKAVGKAKAFSAENPASELIPYYLAYTSGRFHTLSNGSSVKVTYNNSIDAPAILSELASASDYMLSTVDYKTIWGSETDFISAVTPATAAKLANVIPTDKLAEGDYVAVSYNYTSSEPTFGTGGGDDPVEEGYTSVLGSAALDAAVEVKGYVSAVCTQGIVLTDNTGSILVYKASGYSVGDELTVSGTVSAFNKGFQIAASSASIEKTGTTEVGYPTPVELDGAAFDNILARSDNQYAQFVMVKGTVSVSGNYYNFSVEGASTATGSFYGITDEHKAKVADGQTITLYGYLSSISSSGGAPKFVNIIATHIDETPVIANGYTSVLGSAALDEAVEVKGYVSAVCTQGIILTDNGGSVLVYKASGYNVGDELTVNGTISAFNKGFQIAASSATIEKTGTTTVTMPSPRVLDGAAMDEILTRADNEYAQYVAVTGTISVSGNYYNFSVEGASTATGSFYGITDELKAKVADGQTMTIYGYLSSISSSGGAPKFVNIIATDAVAASTASRRAVVTSAIEKRYALYKWDGSKFTAADAAVLQPADYTAMGSTYGDLTAPDAYLPAYLKTTFPYAQADDTKNVVYRLSANSTTVWAADQYIFDGAAWVKNANIEQVTDQFVRQDGKWVYNPSVVITLTPGKGQALSAQYFQAMTDWVWENIDLNIGAAADKKGTHFVTSYGNNEYYTGASAYQGNIDLRPGSARSQYGEESYQGSELVEAGCAFSGDGYSSLTDEKVVELMTKRIQYVMGKVLSKLHPDAKPVDGIEVTYTVNFGIYEGFTISSCTHQIVYKVVGPAEFEFVEMKKL